MPAWDDQTQFEFLILEGAQAGLSWSTILNKREGYREAFAGFDPERIARFGKRDVARLMKNPGIVRNRLKIESAISQRARVSWIFRRARRLRAAPVDASSAASRSRIAVDEHKQVPATTPESDALSKDLKKRGFRFVGSTIIYAHMQATGMVNDHLAGASATRSARRWQQSQSEGAARPLLRRRATRRATLPFPAQRRVQLFERVAHLAVELPRRIRDHQPRAVQAERRVRRPHASARAAGACVTPRPAAPRSTSVTARRP